MLRPPLGAGLDFADPVIGIRRLQIISPSSNSSPGRCGSVERQMNACIGWRSAIFRHDPKP
jgi:hypothetical protein